MLNSAAMLHTSKELIPRHSILENVTHNSFLNHFNYSLKAKQITANRGYRIAPCQLTHQMKEKKKNEEHLIGGVSGDLDNLCINFSLDESLQRNSEMQDCEILG